MKNSEKTMEKIVALCKGRGFVYSGSEIYGGLANTWDYGPLGVEFKNNVKAAWRKKFVQESQYNVGLDSAILMNPMTWVASGHVGGFSDPLMDCKECKERFRADTGGSDRQDRHPRARGRLHLPARFPGVRVRLCADDEDRHEAHHGFGRGTERHPARAQRKTACRRENIKGEIPVNAKTTEQKTAVFTPCAESAEATRAFPVLDEDTRELPLIADRFAGRYWDGRMEKETDETGEKPARKKTWRSALAFAAAAVAAMLLLVGSLTGQAELTAMNDELVAVSERISELKAEERTLLVETEKAESLAAVESYAVGTLGMELPRLDQRNTGASELSDRATVLHARRGQALRYFWENLLDTVMACF